MASTTFTNALGGNWNVGANWSGVTVPGGTDDAVISNPGTYTVSITNTQGPNSITLNDATAPLSVGATGIILGSTMALNAGTFALANLGQVLGSTITAAGAVLAGAGGTLD